MSCAGIFEQGNWFDPNLTIESVKKDSGNLKTLDVNVIGTLHFHRIGAVFLREGKQKGDNKSLTILSSVNAFRESPHLYIYQVSLVLRIPNQSFDKFASRLASTPSMAYSAHRERYCTKTMVSE